jgi:predicted transcriptional regulator
MNLKMVQALMKECRIRHLPIMSQGQLAGLISDRDLREAMALPEASKLMAQDVMKTDLFVVQKSMPLLDVVNRMKIQKVGCVLVVNDARDCIGIFTTINALGMLADFLKDDEQEADLYLLEDYMDGWEDSSSARSL